MIGAIAFAFTSFLVVPAASAATTAGAQTCDPAYGCTPTTPPPGSPASCNVVPASAGPDVVVTVRLTNVGLDVPVNLTFDGKVINGGLTTADGKGTTSSALPVVTAAAGKHPLLLVGAGILCDPTAGAQFEVLPPTGRLGISQTATGGIELSFKLAAATAATPPGSGGSGSLARTGMQIALFLAAALVALVIGWSLVQAARRRRRRVEQARNEVRDLSHH
ncbi:MAG: hypothetical protein ABIV94_04740 [Acidimicrobiales bacterium]